MPQNLEYGNANPTEPRAESPPTIRRLARVATEAFGNFGYTLAGVRRTPTPVRKEPTAFFRNPFGVFSNGGRTLLVGDVLAAGGMGTAD